MSGCLRRVRWGIALALALGPALGLAGCEDLLQEPDSGIALAPVRLEVDAGDGQTGAPGRALPAPLRVRILDAEGRPISRMWVEWTADAGSGRATPRNTFTDADGIAETTWTLGPGAGKQELRANIGQAGLVFRATAAP